MATEKTKIETPKGDLMYVNVSGQGKLDYDGKYYEYTAGVKLNKKDAKKLYAEICEYFEENKPSWFKGDKPTNKIKRKQDDGDFLFNFKTRAEFENDDGDVRKTQIKIVNAHNKIVNLPEGEGIGNGSYGRISGTMTIHSDKKKGEAGVSLWLSGIKILKYVKYIPDAGFSDDDEGDFEDFGGADGDFPEEEKKSKKKDKKKKKSKKD